MRIGDIADRIEDLARTSEDQPPDKGSSLRTELEHLAQGIRNAKAEIAMVHPDEIVGQHLPAARDELNAIVAATAEATDSILSATEIVEAVTQDADGEDSQRLLEATSRIYEACGFQDITGQRVGKVVKALDKIEKTMDALLEAFGGEIEDASRRSRAKKKKEGPLIEEDMLEGPQKEGEGASQAEVDALLASFD
ncbi:MAG: protein phosphatase CheZ [Rhodospirillales bacterium]|nr:protein phosphatase CheZ [Rhodospirillales bacterium]